MCSLPKPPERLKILDVTPSFRPAFSYGGPIESSYQLCRHLAEAGCEVRVLTTDSGGTGRHVDVPLGIDVPMGPRFAVRYCHKLARNSISLEFLKVVEGYVQWSDVVHLTSIYNFTTFPLLLACRRQNKPLLWSPRGTLQAWTGMRRPFVKRFYWRIAQMVAPEDFVLHVTSELEGEQSTAFLRAKKVVVIPNGIEVPATVSHTDSTGILRIAFIGRLDPKKGVENLLDACAQLAAGKFAFTLRIAGEGIGGYSDTLRSRAEKHGIASQVTFLGDLRDVAKRELFENADVLVVPSYVENFGIVVAEGLAHAVPVIASTGTPWEKMEKIGCGLWVNNEPASLAGAIRRISTMPLAEMGARGRQWMERDFSWPVMAGRMLDEMRQMLVLPRAVRNRSEVRLEGETRI